MRCDIVSPAYVAIREIEACPLGHTAKIEVLLTHALSIPPCHDLTADNHAGLPHRVRARATALVSLHPNFSQVSPSPLSPKADHRDQDPLRIPAKEKPEMTDADIAQIREALNSEPGWMSDCFEVAINEGCRLIETAVALKDVSLERGTIMFRGKGGKVFTTALMPGLRPLVERKIQEGAKRLVDLPKMPAKQWWMFFKKIGLGHLSFHGTRVTVITRLARSGVPQGIAQRFVGHATPTIHRAYQRLTVPDLSSAVSALASISAKPGTSGDPKPTAQSAA